MEQLFQLLRFFFSTPELGCETLFEGTSPIKADVVFVHGLHGHRKKTWTKGDVCWPKELLSKEDSLSHIRVLTFGYDANVINPNGHVSLNSLFDHSLSLLHELSRERRSDAEDRPIIFVAHSLGGIIVKDAISHSEHVRDTQPHLSHIASASRGIIFLGTPHRGSDMSSLVKVVARVSQVVLRDANVNLIQDLERDSQTLDRIRDNFSRILHNHKLTVWSFVEELAISGVGRVVVDSDSAIIGDVHENRETIHADHFGMAKFSSRDDPGYKQVLNAIEMALEGLDDDTSQRTSGTVVNQKVPTLYEIPEIQVSHFVARKALLTRLEELFKRSPTALSRLIVVLIGMGGVGKTQLALEFCLRLKDSETFQAIFWLDASSLDSVYRALEIIAKRLFPGQVFDNPQDAAMSVKEVLSSWKDAWLMVVDNLDNPSDLQDILQVLPNSRSGSILVTSRYAGSKEIGQAIEIDCMEEPEGLELLLQSLEPDPGELAAAEDILARLGYLPLAIDQARAYISRRGLSLREFVDEFETRKQNIMEETPQYWQYRRTLLDETKVSLSLLTTWEMSLPLLEDGDAGKLRDALTLFAFFHPVSISEKLFIHNDGDSSSTIFPMSVFDDTGYWDHSKFEDAVLRMQELSLLRFSRRSQNEIVVSLHSMVSEWLRMRLNANLRSTFLTAAISRLGHYIASTQHTDYTTRQETLSHIDTVCRFSEFDTKSDSVLEACYSFGRFYYDHGRLRDAEKIYNRALSGMEKLWGPNHISTLAIVNNIGALYVNQGRLEDAEGLYNRVLPCYEKTLGRYHTITIDIVNNLGLLYADQGRFDDAERMYNRALSGREKSLGPDHTSTILIVSNLGSLYADQGRLDDAEKLYNRALTGYEKSLGPDHTSTLDTINNIGNLYANQRRFEDAERLYHRALTGYEISLGPDHISALTTVNNLGSLYADQGRLDDAERMYNRALSGKEKSLGPDHTSTIDIVNNLGALYKRQGRLEDAEIMYDRALSRREKLLGPNHTLTLRTATNLGVVYADQGRLEDAERMYYRALNGREKLLGPDHSSTLRTVCNFVLPYWLRGHLEDTGSMLNRVLTCFEKSLGPNYTSTLSAVSDLGCRYKSQGRLEDAERMFNRALTGFEKELGHNHTSTLHTFCDFGLLYGLQGRLEDAERMLNRALTGYEKSLGPNHTSTLSVIFYLGCHYESQGRLEDAERMFNRALNGFEKELGPDHSDLLKIVTCLELFYKGQGRLEDAEKMHSRAHPRSLAG